MDTIENVISVRGYVSIKAVYKNGLEEVLWENHNLVVNNGLTILTELIGQSAAGAATPANNNLSIVKAGTGNTAPTVTDTDLGASVVSLSTTTTLAPGGSIGVVEFVALMDTTHGNGSTFQECGLFTTAGRMFSRQLHGAIAKTNTLSIQYTWRISFA